VQRLAGKVAVVTGASRGVGRGIALVLGEEGATVYVTARSVRGASTRPYLPGTTIDDTAGQVDARGGVGVPVQCDHTDQAQIEALFDRVRREQGHLDLLVNNAWGGYEEQEGRHKSGRPFWEWSVSR
jgi:NAD(P)-dependent dehydrogenase (short-subunit alcohol dehydrogenase family)